ncbi:MAG: sugar isomerase domain-containing protein, partial [Micromonosporaceae bacterium]
EYLATAIATLQRLHDTQRGPIQRAADLVADAIAAGGFAHLFGAGHSHQALEEAFPRNGGLVGMRPLTELALSYYTPVVGNSGADQMRFFQEVDGLGEIIWRNYRFRQTDCFIVFTNTGVTKVALDIAWRAREAGHSVIGVTSLDHAAATGTDHSGGRRLHEIADVVIDNCSPAGDAVVRIPGVAEPCGAVSTVTAVSVVNAIATEAARRLVVRGEKPWILASPYFEGDDVDVQARRRAAKAQWDACMDEFRRRFRGMW